MKVNTNLCKGIANQQDEQGWHDNFYPEVYLVATKLVLVVSIAHLVVRRLIDITRQAHTLGTAETYPQVRVAQWHAQLELLFAAPAGQTQYPS
jgi:uncharacterized membrane protein YhaH (DUF805 family)